MATSAKKQVVAVALLEVAAANFRTGRERNPRKLFLAIRRAKRYGIRPRRIQRILESAFNSQL